MFRHAQYVISLQERTISAQKAGVRRNEFSRKRGHDSPSLKYLGAGRGPSGSLTPSRPIARAWIESPRCFILTFRNSPPPTAAVYLCQQVPQTWLTPSERQFVANLAKYKHKPSEAQLDILATIASNVIANGGAK
jgi:hypothetical protein